MTNNDVPLAGAPPPPPPPTQPPSTPLGAAEPGPPPASPRPSRRFRGTAITVAAVVVAVAAAGGVLAYRVLGGSGDSLVAMVPADTAVYVNVNLDPSAGQKLAAKNLLDKFPTTGGQAGSTAVNDWLDTAFRSTGLTYSKDISPWVGSNISVAVSASALTAGSSSGGGNAVPPAVILVASSDDGKAQAALTKLQNGPAGAGGPWTTSTDNGVTVTTGPPGPSTGAYAIVNHTVVFGSSTAAVDAVIDTAQGRRANLSSSSSYTRVLSELPGERLTTVYADVAGILKAVQSELHSASAATPDLNLVAGYRGVGLALVASSDGVAIDGTEDVDPSQLSADQRAQLSAPPHVNGSLGFVPAGAYGVETFTSLQATLREGLNAVAPAGSSLANTLEQYGLLGPSGIIGHLSGDAGIEAGKGSGPSAPAGSLVFDTDSSDAAQHFIATLVTQACAQTTSCDPSQVTTQTDQGVTISTLAFGDSSGTAAIAPSWAVSNGWVVIGTTPAEVRAALDAHASGSGIATSPGFTAMATHIGTSNNAMMYIDVPAIASAVRAALPSDAQSTYDSKVAPYLDHIKGFGMSETNHSDHATFSLFTLIG